MCIWWNKVIFENDFQRPFNAISVVLKMVEDIAKCIHHSMNSRLEDAICIGWKRPREWWTKLNCDGAYQDTQTMIQCGGLMRRSCGRWLTLCSRKIGICDDFSTGIWGYTYVCSLLGYMVSTILRWKMTQKLQLT